MTLDDKYTTGHGFRYWLVPAVNVCIDSSIYRAILDMLIDAATIVTVQRGDLPVLSVSCVPL